MTRRTTVGLRLAGAMLAVLAVVAARGADAKNSKPNPDLSGEWRLDRAKSDLPEPGEGMRRPGGHPGWRGQRPPDGRPGGMMRGRRLPEVLRVEQTGELVQLADSTGTELEEIHFGATSKEESSSGEIPVLWGRWHDDKLEVERSGGRGTMTRTFELDDKGRTLVIKTELKGPMRSMSFKHVYRKLSTS